MFTESLFVGEKKKQFVNYIQKKGLSRNLKHFIVCRVVNVVDWDTTFNAHVLSIAKEKYVNWKEGMRVPATLVEMVVRVGKVLTALASSVFVVLVTEEIIVKLLQIRADQIHVCTVVYVSEKNQGT